MKERISWCATTSKNDESRMGDVLDSIHSQTIKPYEVLITRGGNISEGRNKYLTKFKGDYLASFDGGCIYEANYGERMLRCLRDNNADIVIGIVKPLQAKNRIQGFCVGRMPDYENFTSEDWKNFIPSNRQVIVKREAVKRLGLLPEELWRSDDTYWFQRAKRIGLRFSYCSHAIVYWEMKTSLKGYLRTVYNDTKCDHQFGIPSFSATKRKRQKLSLISIVIMILAGIVKIFGIIAGKINFKKRIRI